MATSKAHQNYIDWGRFGNRAHHFRELFFYSDTLFFRHLFILTQQHL